MGKMSKGRKEEDVKSIIFIINPWRRYVRFNINYYKGFATSLFDILNYDIKILYMNFDWEKERMLKYNLYESEFWVGNYDSEKVNDSYRAKIMKSLIWISI